MTNPSTTPDTPYDVVISDATMAEINTLPPEAIDELATAIGRMREDPASVSGSLPLVPVPVDHSEGRERVYVPATRSASYLRGAVADISPETVAHLDAELQQMTRLTGDGRDGQIHRFRMWTLRWVEYIALQGDHDSARYVNASQSAEELAERFTQAMRRVHAECFPDAGAAPGSELSVQTRPRPGGGHTAICPVTQLRANGPTQDQAQAHLRGLLVEWVTG